MFKHQYFFSRKISLIYIRLTLPRQLLLLGASIQNFSDLNAKKEVKKLQVTDEAIVKHLISEVIRITELGTVEA